MINRCAYDINSTIDNPPFIKLMLVGYNFHLLNCACSYHVTENILLSANVRVKNQPLVALSGQCFSPHFFYFFLYGKSIFSYLDVSRVVLYLFLPAILPLHNKYLQYTCILVTATGNYQLCQSSSISLPCVVSSIQVSCLYLIID